MPYTTSPEVSRPLLQRGIIAAVSLVHRCNPLHLILLYVQGAAALNEVIIPTPRSALPQTVKWAGEVERLYSHYPSSTHSLNKLLELQNVAGSSCKNNLDVALQLFTRVQAECKNEVELPKNKKLSKSRLKKIVKARWRNVSLHDDQHAFELFTSALWQGQKHFSYIISTFLLSTDITIGIVADDHPRIKQFSGMFLFDAGTDDRAVIFKASALHTNNVAALIAHEMKHGVLNSFQQTFNNDMFSLAPHPWKSTVSEQEFTTEFEQGWDVLFESIGLIGNGTTILSHLDTAKVNYLLKVVNKIDEYSYNIPMSENSKKMYVGQILNLDDLVNSKDSASINKIDKLGTAQIIKIHKNENDFKISIQVQNPLMYIKYVLANFNMSRLLKDYTPEEFNHEKDAYFSTWFPVLFKAYHPGIFQRQNKMLQLVDAVAIKPKI